MYAFDEYAQIKHVSTDITGWLASPGSAPSLPGGALTCPSRKRPVPLLGRRWPRCATSRSGSPASSLRDRLRARRWRDRPRRSWWSSAQACRASGRRCGPRNADQTRTCCWWRVTGSPTPPRAQRRLRRVIHHPRLPQRPVALAGRVRHLVPAGVENLDGIEATIARYGIDCDFRRSGELDVATEGLPSRDAGRARRRTQPARDWTDAARSRAGPRPSRLADLPGRRPRRRRRAGGSGAVVVRARGRRRSARRPHRRRDAGDRDSPGRGRAQTGDAAGRDHDVAGGLDHGGASAAAASYRCLRGAGLRPRRRHRAAARRRARRHRLGRRRRAVRLRQPVPLLPAHARWPHPVGWLRRRLHPRRASRGRRGSATTSSPLGWSSICTTPSRQGRGPHRIHLVGAIDTCARFSAFWGKAYARATRVCRRLHRARGGASRFGADVLLDLLWRERSERTQLSMVGSKPMPFPPEPVRQVVIDLTRSSIARADANAGERNLWLRTLDRMGLGFDS